jgi:hypothetical protein
VRSRLHHFATFVLPDAVVSSFGLLVLFDFATVSRFATVLRFATAFDVRLFDFATRSDVRAFDSATVFDSATAFHAQETSVDVLKLRAVFDFDTELRVLKD